MNEQTAMFEMCPNDETTMIRLADDLYRALLRDTGWPEPLFGSKSFQAGFEVAMALAVLMPEYMQGLFIEECRSVSVSDPSSFNDVLERTRAKAASIAARFPVSVMQDVRA